MSPFLSVVGVVWWILDMLAICFQSILVKGNILAYLFILFKKKTYERVFPFKNEIFVFLSYAALGKDTSI